MEPVRTLLAILLASVMMAVPAEAFETRAKSAFVVDMTTGTVLLNKNADEPLPPASMSKLMTLYVTFEAVRDGRLSLDEKLPVSEHAMSLGGSTMFLDTTDRVSVIDLIRGIIVMSGNDACVVLAEALSPNGTERGFADFMTRRGQQMGLSNSVFRNASGWPEAGHVMSMRDLALLTRRLIEDFPEYYPMFAETEFLFDGRAPQNTTNRNPVLTLDIGADGLKTGHTRESGYSFTGSAKQGDRRIIWVISGLETAQERARESESIVNWAFRQFTQKDIVRAGTELARADVWMGSANDVGLTVAEDLTTLIPVMSSADLKAEIVYDGPLRSPIRKGDPVATMIFASEGLPEMSVPLVAMEDVDHGGVFSRLGTVTGLLLARMRQGPEEAL